jgi:hypothetical protein
LLLKCTRKVLENVPGGSQRISWNIGYDSPDRRFNSLFHIHIELSAPRGKPQENSAFVVRIDPTSNKTAPLKSPENTRERARVQLHDLCKLAGSNARKPPYNPYDQPLWSGYAQRRCHSFGHSMQRVIGGPEKPQEIQCRIKNGHSIPRFKAASIRVFHSNFRR